jgi:hypothetical protein
MKEVIITGIGNPTSEGVILYTNIPAKLKNSSFPTKEFWVSWDKIGSEIFENYTTLQSVEDRDKLRNKKP